MGRATGSSHGVSAIRRGSRGATPAATWQVGTSIHTVGMGSLPATEETITAAKTFLAQHWQEWLAENRRPDHGDLRGACVFATAFARLLFGGSPVGNWHHLRLKVGEIHIDFTEASGVREQALERDAEYRELEAAMPSFRRPSFFQGTDPDPLLHQPDYLRSPDFIESWHSVQPRAQDWAKEFLAITGAKDASASGAKVLYHGTHSGVSSSIEAEGIVTQNRMGVWRCPQLTDSLEAAGDYAKDLAQRKGTEPVIYEVTVEDESLLFDDSYHNDTMPGNGYEYDGDLPPRCLRQL